VASLDCDGNSTAGGPRYARYTLFPDQFSLDTAFQQSVQSVTTQPCPGGISSPGTWNVNSDPNTPLGSILCGTFSGNADVLWTQNSDLVMYAVQGSDLASLYRWWQGVPIASGGSAGSTNRVEMPTVR
jgi:serine/threonine-protein kinase